MGPPFGGQRCASDQHLTRSRPTTCLQRRRRGRTVGPVGPSVRAPLGRDRPSAHRDARLQVERRGPLPRPQGPAQPLVADGRQQLGRLLLGDEAPAAQFGAGQQQPAGVLGRRAGRRRRGGAVRRSRAARAAPSRRRAAWAPRSRRMPGLLGDLPHPGPRRGLARPPRPRRGTPSRACRWGRRAAPGPVRRRAGPRRRRSRRSARGVCTMSQAPACAAADGLGDPLRRSRAG